MSITMLAGRAIPRRGSPLARFRQSQKQVKRSQRPRSFSQNSQLRIVLKTVSRPQLPYLYATTMGRLSIPRGQSQNQLVRSMSFETTRYYQDVLKKSLLLSGVFMACMLLYAISKWMVQIEIMAQKFPAPSEWNWFWKFQLSHLAADQIPNEDGRVVDWSYIADSYLGLLKLLEDPEQGGKDLRPISEDKDDIYIDRIRKAGMDLSKKSDQWRNGYHASLMGAARALEHVDGWVVDTTRRSTFAPEYMIGPSNPFPKPVRVGMLEAPLEENCKPAFPGPEPLYTKILTSHGFTSGQRLEAALAYADWLDFKGLSSDAEEMYEWGLDIAMGALPVGINDVVDMKTGIINSKATYVSSNILTATTALACHHARNNNLAAALPILLSILRARRHLLLPNPPKTEQEMESPASYVLSMAKSLLIGLSDPALPPTGDEVPSRTQAAICEEAAVMSHVGEILFASSSFKNPKRLTSDPIFGPQIHVTATTEQLQNFQSGLSWTRDAVDLAEETLASIGSSEEEQEARTKCTQCLSAGMNNWSTMVERMLLDERAARVAPKTKKNALSTFWGGQDNSNDNQNRWEGEARIVDTRSRRIKRLLASEQNRSLPLWMTMLNKVKDY